ncbi:MAG: metallophosphoesterase [Kofleriaceae bacterium]
MKSWVLVLAFASVASAGKVKRDWSAHPAIVERDDVDEIYAVSDPHGGATQLQALLEANHLIKGKTWTGGSAVLVVAGDLIDKGPDSLGVIDLLRGLGSHVIVTMGNHEAEFLADPQNKKAAIGIDVELKDKAAAVAAASDPDGRGRWLADLPFGVRIKKWFFAHGGNTGGDSIAKLSKRLQDAVDKDGFGAKDITGGDSILEAQNWYADKDTGSKYADALGVKHIVFGHDPGAFGDKGHILASKDGSLIKIDVMMGLTEKKAVTGGLLLHIKTKGQDSVEILDSSGTATPLKL